MDLMFISDPGHSWLRIPIVEAEKYEFKPSTYSFADHRYYYLEEDIDAADFIDIVFNGELPQYVHLEVDDFNRYCWANDIGRIHGDSV